MTSGSTGDPAKYCLKWNNFGRNVTSAFKSLLANEELTDISLTSSTSAGSSKSALKAHKVVLSASSQYFRDQLQNVSPWQHPVFLLDVPYRDLEGIVEFIYHGEVSVDQECLESFLKTAQLLRVKGLTDDNPNASSSNNMGTSGSGNNNNNFSAASLPSRTNVGSNNALNSLQHHLGSAGEEEDEEDEEDEEEEEEEGPVEPHLQQQHLQQKQHQHHSRKSSNPKRAKVKATALSANTATSEVANAEAANAEAVEGAGNNSESEESEIGVGGEFAGEIDDREEEEIAAVQQIAQQQQQQQQAAAAAAMMHHFMSQQSAAQAAVAAVASTGNKKDGSISANPDGCNMDVDEGADQPPPSIMSSLLDSDAITLAGLNPPRIQSMLQSLPAPPPPPGMQLGAPGNPPGLVGAPPSGAAGQAKKTCPFCLQQLSWHALSRHIRDMHKAKPQLVDCKFCGKSFRNKNSLGCHMWRFHKEKTGGATRQMEPGPPGNPALSVPPGMLSGVPGTSDPKEETPMMVPAMTPESDL